MLGSSSPLRLAFVVLSDSQMLVRVLLIGLENDFSVFIHDLMRLSDYKSLLSFTSEDQELNCFLLEASGLAILSDHEGTLGKL